MNNEEKSCTEMLRFKGKCGTIDVSVRGDDWFFTKKIGFRFFCSNICKRNVFLS